MRTAREDLPVGQLRGLAAPSPSYPTWWPGHRERPPKSLTIQHVTKVRVLQNRFSGDTGIACLLRYDPKTGRLAEEAADSSTIAASAKDGKDMF